MLEEELIRNGSNIFDVHVDFMRSTDDLKIEADTKKDEKLIYEKVKFIV